MTNQSKQQEIINTLSLLTDEQIHILNEFINSFVPNKKGQVLFSNDYKTAKKELSEDRKYLISDLLAKDWSKLEEDKAWQNL